MDAPKKCICILALPLVLGLVAYFTWHSLNNQANVLMNERFSHIKLPDGQKGDFRPIAQLGQSAPQISLTELDTRFSISTQWITKYDTLFVDAEVPIDTGSLRVNPRAPVVVVIPGYMSGEQVGWAERVASKWRLLNGLATVVVVTWNGGSVDFYERVVQRTPLVARQITILLAYLAEAGGTTLNDAAFVGRIELVGHSLGAHIAAFVGQDLEGRVGRIVGLDPAGPSFDQMPKEHRLSKDDAKLVQVLHTNGGSMKVLGAIASIPLESIDHLAQLLTKVKRARDSLSTDQAVGLYSAWFGTDLQLGHLDYYANGGGLQPGCEDIVRICDHKRAHELYSALLDRQIQLIHSNGRQPAISSSLMTFYSDSYQQFLQEGSVQSRCFLGELGFLRGCGVWLDVFSRPDDILAIPMTGEKLFFQTNRREPLIGDQYLLQMKLATKMSWNERCALQLKFTFAGNQTRTVLINRHLKAAENDILAIPFVGPQTFTAFLGQKQLDDEVITFPLDETDRQSKSMIIQSLPSSISMDISAAEAVGLFESMRRMFAQIFGLDPPPDGCLLAITAWKIRLLLGGQGKKIVGTYVDPSLSREGGLPISILHTSADPPVNLTPIEISVGNRDPPIRLD